MMRYLLIFSTIFALLGCPLRCALGQVGGSAAIVSEENGAIQSSGCACCRHHSPPTECDSTSSACNETDSDSAPSSPGSDDCHCLCLCKGAIIEKHVDFPQWDHLDQFLPALFVDELIFTHPLLANAIDWQRWASPSSPPSGRSIRYVVQSLLI